MSRTDLREHTEGPLRVLAVHAHPDDETLWSGLTLARHVEDGDEVHVLTCTLGEEGEVITPSLKHLEGEEALAGHRAGELARAVAALGVRHHLLGARSGPDGAPVPRWRDSGMAGSAAHEHPRALAGAPLSEVAAVLAEQIAQIGPDLVLTYDPWGGYGHPDHIRVHRATVEALSLLRGRRGEQGERSRPRLYVALVPESWARHDRAWLAEHVPAGVRSPDGGPVRVPGADEPAPPSVVPDDLVTHEVLASPEAISRRNRAMDAHTTQITRHGDWYTLSNDIAARCPDREGWAAWPDCAEALARAQGGVPE